MGDGGGENWARTFDDFAKYASCRRHIVGMQAVRVKRDVCR